LTCPQAISIILGMLTHIPTFRSKRPPLIEGLDDAWADTYLELLFSEPPWPMTCDQLDKWARDFDCASGDMAYEQIRRCRDRSDKGQWEPDGE
jgi:hypothetical protein